MESPNIEVLPMDQRFRTGAWQLPDYQTVGAAAIDLMAAIDEPIVISPGECVLIPTGIAININDVNCMGVILPRSGLGHKKGLILGNGTGVIDSDYQGQLFVSAWNRNPMDPSLMTVIHQLCDSVEGKKASKDSIIVSPKDRFAQLAFVPVYRPTFTVVDAFSEKTLRGEGGFNSTGTR